MQFCTLILLYLPVGILAYPKIKIVPAAHLLQIPDVTFYEETVKLLFSVPMPIRRPIQKPSNSSNRPKLTENITELLLADLAEELFDQIDDQDAVVGQSRVRRGDLELILGGGGGFVIGSVLTRAWDNFFGKDREVRDNVRQLRRNVEDFQKEVVVVESQLNQYTVMVSEVYKKIKAGTSSEFAEVFHDMLMIIQRNWLVESKSSCILRRIPRKLVSQQVLYKELTKMDSKIGKYNKTLAISTQSLSRYYKLPVADCTFTPTQLVVVVNVPIIRIGNSCKLFEIVHTKFAYNNQTCSVYPQEANFLAQCTFKSVLITTLNYVHTCNVHEHGLCRVPQFTKDSSESLSCALGLLESKPVKELHQYCAFRCSSNAELIVQILDENTIVLTNAVFLEMNCLTEYKNYTFTKQGAVHVRLQCNCTLLVDSYYFIDSPIFCHQLNQMEEPVYGASPNLWSRLETAVGSSTQFFQEHTNQTFNENWPMNMPVLNLTIPKIQVIPEPELWDSEMLNYTNLWLLALTAVLAIQFWITCHMFRAYMRP